jgi:hypothetical protein
VRPDSPSRETLFIVSGAAAAMMRVQLHETSCAPPVLAELSAEEFSLVGFPVEVAPNLSRTVAVRVVNDDVASDCVAMTLTNDRIAPSLTVRLASPSPSPQRSAYVVTAGEGEITSLYAGPDCSGPLIATGGRPLEPEFPPDASTSFSVWASDRAGNGTCVPGDRPWVNDPSLPEEEAVVLVPQPRVFGFATPPLLEVPWNRGFVQVFHSADCSGPVALEDAVWSLLASGLYLPQGSMSGPLTARSSREDGGWDPCSNAVDWQP